MIKQEGDIFLKQQERLEDTISNNRDKLIRDINGVCKVNIELIDLIDFSEGEQKEVRNGLELYNKLCDLFPERIDLLISDEEQDYEQFYIIGEQYSWELILYDLEQKILSNLTEDKEKTLKSFRLLSKLYNEYNDKIKDRDELNVRVIKQIQ